jgi:hypothetical protein
MYGEEEVLSKHPDVWHDINPICEWGIASRQNILPPRLARAKAWERQVKDLGRQATLLLGRHRPFVETQRLEDWTENIFERSSVFYYYQYQEITCTKTSIQKILKAKPSKTCG